MKNFDVRREFVKLRAEGKSLQEIADTLGIAKGTACIWAKDFDDEITELQKLKMEALYKEYEATTEARLRVLHNTLSKVNEAVERTDFSALQPDRMIEIQMKLIKTIGGYYRPYTVMKDEEKDDFGFLIGKRLDCLDEWEKQAKKDEKIKGFSPDSLENGQELNQN